MMITRCVVVSILLTIAFNASSQQEEAIVFKDASTDTLTTEAEPVGGYNALLKYLEQQVSEGDTVGKQFSVHIYSVRFNVNPFGVADSAYIAIPHDACPLHKKIISELRKTKWIPARKYGEPVTSHHQLYGRLHFTKPVLKKYHCR